MSRLSKDVERAEQGIHLLRSSTSPSRSSPLAPPSDREPSTSYSSGDDSESNQERKDTPNGTPRQRVRPEPLLSRRALFVRVDNIAAASRSSSWKGKQRRSTQAAEANGDLLSPRIILSPDADGSASDGPSSSSFSQAVPRSSPSLSLTLPGDSSSDQPPSPITLLSPQNLNGHRPPSGVSEPDTHGEALKRLLYIFCRANPHLPYAAVFVDILVPLYLVFAEAGYTSQSHAPQGHYAEEETYWAFSALMAELGDVVSATAGNDNTLTVALQRMGRHLRWADEPLWSILCSRNLDPSQPLYTFQWISGLMTHDKSHLLPIWDHIFSQPPPTPDSTPRLEALINLGVAVICLLKKNIMFPPPPSPSKRKGSLWHGAAEMDTYPTTIEEEDPDESFVRCLQLLRNYPLDQLGGTPALLYTAFELKQELQAASVNGTDPDAPGWSEGRDLAKNQSSWGSWKLKPATTDSGGASWSRYSESDAAASLAKASSNLTAAAMAKWSTAPAVPSWKSVGAAAGKWWKPVPKEDESFDGSDYDHYSSAPSTPGRSPQSHRFGSPEKRSSHPSIATGITQRGRSDSGTSNLSVSSLQDRLSGLASTLGHGTHKETPTPRTASGPRPLLLSSSARRASSSARDRPRVSSPSPASHNLSTPPPESLGLYRIRSQSRRSPPKRSSLGDSVASGSKRDTIDSSTTQCSALSFGSDTDSRRDSASTPYDSDTSAALTSIKETAANVNDLPTPRVVPSVIAPTQPTLPALTINTAPAVSSPSVSAATLQPEPPSPADVISIPTPKISHLTEDDYDHVYEPAEDSFILLDALEEDARVLRAARPALSVEIGSGSGICSTFITSVLGVTDTFVLSTDINQFAANATLRTGEANGAPLNPVLCNLLDPLRYRLTGQIDLLVFNPPYVETEEAEMTATQQQRDIGGAWAGGNFGMTVTNLVLDKLPGLLAPGGRFYLVAIEQNKPKEIVARMRATGLECKVVMKRRAGRELLSVIRMIRPEGLQLPPAQQSAPSPVSPGDAYGSLLEAYQ